jgi:transmembrane sensor
MDVTERRNRASEEAAEWWLRIKRDDMPKPERERFVDWLRESPVHVAEMLRMAQVDGALERYERWAQADVAGAAEPGNVIALDGERSSTQEPRPRRARATRWPSGRAVGALAAAIALIIVAGFLLVPFTRGTIVVTDRGERRELALADGSVIQMDPQTQLRIQLEGDSRHVRLTQGRAFFRVARDPQRPFSVQVDDTLVRAIGTAFGVERSPQGAVITVAEGKVAVSRGASGVTHGDEILSAPNGAAVPEILLTVNEQTTVPDAGPAAPVRKVDSDRSLAWAEGRLVFENDTVAKVVEQFNRYNRVQLQVTDEALARRRLTGVFSASDPESFLAFIAAVANVRVIRRDAERITLGLEPPQ